MALTRAEAIDASFPNAADIRKHMAGLIIREGVFPDPTTVAGIAVAGTGWNVTAQPFVLATKRGGAAVSQTYGVALASNDGAQAGAWLLPGAPGSGSRTDILWVRARDSGQGDSTSGAPTDGPAGATRTGFVEFGVSTVLPAGAVEIARAVVSSSATSAASGTTITQTVPFTHFAGSVVYFRNAAELNAYAPAPGTLGFQGDTSAFYVRASGAWSALAGSTAPHFGYRKTNGFQFTATPTDHAWDNTPYEGVLAGFSTTDQVTFTCTIPGVYAICGQLTSGPGTSSTDVYFLKNGTTLLLFYGFANANYYAAQKFAVSQRFALGETFKIQLSGSGTTAGVSGAGTQGSFFTVDFQHG